MVIVTFSLLACNIFSTKLKLVSGSFIEIEFSIIPYIDVSLTILRPVRIRLVYLHKGLTL